MRSVLSLLFLCLVFSLISLTGRPAWAQEKNWQSLGGIVDFKASTNWGTKGVAAATNRVGLRKDVTVWTGADGKFYLYGGTGQDAAKALKNATNNVYDTTVGNEINNKSDLSDLWRYDPATNLWTWIAGTKTGEVQPSYGTRGTPSAANTPGGRHQAATWTGADGSLYLYGGASYICLNNYLLPYTFYYNDLWRYNPTAGTWTWLSGSKNAYTYLTISGVYGRQGVPSAANTPGVLPGALTWTGKDGNLYLYGGSGVGLKAANSNTTTSGLLSDLWRFDPKREQWTWLSGNAVCGQLPSYYGLKGTFAAGNTPGSRRDSVTWVGSDGKLYLFGGFRGFISSRNGDIYFDSGNDLWCFDLAKKQWAWLAGSSSSSSQPGIYGTRGVASPENTPGSRGQALSWTGKDGKLYLMGGNGYASAGTHGSLGDLWQFDPASKQWTWIGGSSTANPAAIRGTQGVPAATNDPGSQAGAACWRDAQGRLYFFGDGLNINNFPRSTELWRYDVTQKTWVWLSGDLVPRYFTGIYGTQGVAHPANHPSVRVDSATWTDPVDGSFYLFGGFGHDAGDFPTYLNDLWRYDRASGHWTWLKGDKAPSMLPFIHFPVSGTRGEPNAANTPGGLMGSTSWMSADRKLYLFGGGVFQYNNNGSLRNTLWRYDRTSNMWTWLTGAYDKMTTSTYGTLGVPAVANTPGARQGAAGWTGPDGRLYLLGGNGPDATGATGQLNDLWRFDPASGLWTWLGGSTRMSAAGVYGRQFAPDAANWPGARDGATAWTAGGKFYLFGGYGYGASGAPGLLNDLWCYDPAPGQWIWLKGGKTAGASGVYGTQNTAGAANTPGGRKDAAGTVSIYGKCYLFGGTGVDGAGQTGFLNDLWQFDPITLNWTWQRGSKLADQLGSSVISGGAPVLANTPSGRTGAAAWIDNNLNLFIFGGFGLDASGYRSIQMDMWVRGDGVPGGRSAAHGWRIYH